MGQTMRFFTFQWAMGDDGSERDPVAEYDHFLSSFDKNDPIYRFATSINLHDAIFEHGVFDAATNNLALSFLSGDRQIGYSRTEISYEGAEIRSEALLAHALNNRPTEVWYDEIARVGDRLSHDFLLAPESIRGAGRHEFSIEFTSLSWKQNEVPNRGLAASCGGFARRRGSASEDEFSKK